MFFISFQIAVRPDSLYNLVRCILMTAFQTGISAAALFGGEPMLEGSGIILITR